MQQIIYISVILFLLFIIAELYRWNVLYRSINKARRQQNEEFLKIHTDLTNEFIEQFKRYNEQSIENKERIDRYTKMYDTFLDLYKSPKHNP